MRGQPKRIMMFRQGVNSLVSPMREIIKYILLVPTGLDDAEIKRSPMMAMAVLCERHFIDS